MKTEQTACILLMIIEGIKDVNIYIAAVKQIRFIQRISKDNYNISIAAYIIAAVY